MVKNITENHDSFSLEKLRGELTAQQKKYLNKIWRHYLECGQWPRTFDFYQTNDADSVHNTFRARPMSASIILEQTGGGDECFELTLLGILLTKSGRHYQRMRIRLLEFLRKRYFSKNNELKKTELDAGEVVDALKLSEDDSIILGKVGEFDWFHRISGGSIGGTHWKLFVNKKEIPFMPKKGSLATYHEELLFRHYRPQEKVFIKDRHAAQTPITMPKGIFGAIDDFSPVITPGGETLPPIPVPDVSFVKNDELRGFASAAAQEASNCFGAKAFSAMAVMAGSALEAVLLDLFQQHQDKFSGSKNDSNNRHQLGNLINSMLEKNLLGPATGTLTKFIQEHRNLIHPDKYLRNKKIIAQSDALIILGTFMKICEELG